MTEFLGLCLIATLLVIIFLVQKIMNDRSEHRKTLNLNKWHLDKVEEGNLEIIENYENDFLSFNETIDNLKEENLKYKSFNCLLEKQLEEMGVNLEMVLNQEFKP